MDEKPEHPASTPTPFSALLNYLFATRLNPATSKPYTLAEVSKATGGKLSATYLSYLRSGKIANPPVDRVQLLADFFGVDVGYFTGKYTVLAPPSEPRDDELWDALAKPLVREVAKRAGKVGPGERALILQMLERAEQLARAAEAAEAAQASSEAPAVPPSAETPGREEPEEES